MVFEPCAESPLLGVSLAFPAILKAAWSIIEPDFKEAYHKVVGQSIYHDIKQSIREAREVDSVVPEKALRAIFKFADVADMATWYAFLGSVAEDGMYEWTSQMLKMNGCNGSHRGTVLSPWCGGIIVKGIWSELDIVISDGHGGSFVGFSGGRVRRGHTSNFVFYCTPEDLDGKTPDISTRVIIPQTGEILDTDDNSPDENGDRPKKLINFATYTNNTYGNVDIVWQGIFNGGENERNFVDCSTAGGYIPGV